VKPEDWDESQPTTIIDSDAKKPEGWLDDAPEQIPDPDAKKPDDWDDELDGDYEAPLVSNPKCQEFGCGIWSPPEVPNPKYKGKWSPPMIPNPAYKGVWFPKQIPNPNYFEDKSPYLFAPIGALGIEIWTMQSGILFDNFIITYDKKISDTFALETWKVKRAEEIRLKELNEPKESVFESSLKQINGVVEAGIIYARDEKIYQLLLVVLLLV